MPAVARRGDGTTGTCNIGEPCCPHTRSGTNSVCSDNVFANSLAVHRLNDTGPTNCPHEGTFSSITGSGTVRVNGQPIIRIGDTTQCQSCGETGNHTGGSPDVFAG